MADINKLSPIIAKWEGGYVNHRNDKGGPTNMGITLATWKSMGYDKDGDGDIDADDVRLLNTSDFVVILKVYWNRWKASQILSQNIANILVDWVWGSGKWGIVIPQRLLGVTTNGIVGQKTLEALNSQDPKLFHSIIWNERKKFLENIVKNDPSQKVFLKGWLNRLNDFIWKEDIENNYLKVTANSLYVRTGPGTGYTAIEVLQKGDLLAPVEEKDGWVNVNILKSKGCSGWVSKKYVA